MVEFLPDSKRQEARGLYFDSLKKGWLGMEFFLYSKCLGCLLGNYYSL